MKVLDSSTYSYSNAFTSEFLPVLNKIVKNTKRKAIFEDIYIQQWPEDNRAEVKGEEAAGVPEKVQSGNPPDNSIFCSKIFLHAMK